MEPRREDDFIWEGVDQGQLRVQRCDGCGTLRHPPAPMCGDCQSLEWTPQSLSGRGTIFSWLIGKHPTDPDDKPRTIILVDLDEGVRFVSNLVDSDDPKIGDRVSLVFRDVDGMRLPLFERAPS